MKISILGTRGEIPESLPYHSKHSGILVDDVLLIDLGEKQFLESNPQWIVITHFHPDHAYFVRRKQEERPATLKLIYGPEIPASFEDIVVCLNRKVSLGPYTIIPIPTHHSLHVKSQAYVVKKDGQSFLYTGDLVWIDKQYHDLIGKVNLVITEASFIRNGGMVKKDKASGQVFGHNGVPNLMALLKRFSHNMLFVHFGSWFYKNTKEARHKLKLLGKEHNINTITGYDGLVIDLDYQGST